MTPLDLIEVGTRTNPFTFRVNGEVRGFPSPVDLPPSAVLDLLEHGFPISTVEDIPPWKCDLLLGRWAAHYDLGDFRSAQRLLYVVNRYSGEIEYDLTAELRVDLGDLFRARRWRYLLNLIDRLPGHSYYAEAVSNDVEHAEMIAKAEAESEARGERQKSWSPPLRTWTPEVDMTARVVDAVNGLKHVLIAVNSEKGRAGAPPEPTPRPVTVIQKARAGALYRKKLETHKALVARVLPHQAEPVVGQEGTQFLRKKAGLQTDTMKPMIFASFRLNLSRGVKHA